MNKIKRISIVSLSIFAASHLATGCAVSRSSQDKGHTDLTDDGLYVLGGDITPVSARINLATKQSGIHQLVLEETGNPKTRRIVEVTTDRLGDSVISRGSYHLIGLKPGTDYTLSNSTGVIGSLSTIATNAEVIRLMIGSCINHFNDTVQVFPDFNTDANRTKIPNHQIWSVVNDQTFDAAFLIGDRFYLPNAYEDYAGMQNGEFFQLIDEHHEGMMAIPGMKDFLTRTPLYVTWDDHDLGPNDSAGDFEFKTQGLAHAAWSLPQPKMGTDKNPGMYFKTSLGDIDTFVLDGRSFRDCSNRIRDNYRTGEPAHFCGVDGILDESTGIYHPDEMQQNLYGEAQLNWLKQELLTSTAPVKLVIGGNQFLSNIHRFEAWYHYEERQEFLNWLNENPVPGIIFVSGDRHHGEVGVLDQGVPYPLYELTSSGMGTNCYLSDEVNDPDPTRSPFDILGGTSINHFGVIEYNKPDQEISLQLYTSDGELVTNQVIKISALKP